MLVLCRAVSYLVADHVLARPTKGQFVCDLFILRWGIVDQASASSRLRQPQPQCSVVCASSRQQLLIV